jgi:hypothetical protein
MLAVAVYTDDEWITPNRRPTDVDVIRFSLAMDD